MIKKAAPSFTIAGTEIQAGQRAVIELPIASLYTHTGLHLPIHVVHGRKPGPRLLISAAVHGDELNGVEIIRCVLRQKKLERMRGTLIAVPVVNVFGIIQHSRYLPDRRDLNRSFPGSEGGSLAARLAHIFLDSIVKECTHGIDLHTGALHRSNLPQIRANLHDAETLALARAFGVPVLLNADMRDGSLREAADAFGVKMLLYEAGEALRFDEFSIRAGVRGILRVMQMLEMLTSRRRREPAAPFVARSSSWVRATHSGILHSRKKLGDAVEAGALLGTITDPSDMFDGEAYKIHARHDGIIIGRTNLPLVNEGDALYHVASFEDSEGVAAGLDSFQQEFTG